MEQQDNKVSQSIGSLSDVIKAIVDNYTKLTEKADAKIIYDNLIKFRLFLDPVKQILDIIQSINIPNVKVEMTNTINTMSDLGRLIGVSMQVGRNIAIRDILTAKLKIILAINTINDISKSLTSIKIDPSIEIQTEEIISIIKDIAAIIAEINRIGSTKIITLDLFGLKKNIDVIVKFFEDLKTIKYDKTATHDLALIMNDLVSIFNIVCYIGLLSPFIIAFYPIILATTLGVRKLIPKFAQIVRELGGLPDTDNAKKALANIAVVLFGICGLFFLALPAAILSALFIPLYPFLMLGIAGFRELAIELDKIIIPQDTSMRAIWKLGYLIRTITRSMFYMVRHAVVYILFLIVAPYAYAAFMMMNVIISKVNEIIDAFGKTKGNVKFIILGRMTIVAIVGVMRYLRKHIRTFRSIWNHFVLYIQAFAALRSIMTAIIYIVDSFGKLSIGSLIKFMLFALLPFKRAVDIMGYINRHIRIIAVFYGASSIYIPAFILLYLITNIVYNIKFKRAGILRTRKSVLKPYKLLLHIMVYLMRHGRTIKRFARKALIYIPAFLMVQWLTIIAAETILIAITALILITPIMLLFIIASPFIILAVWLFVKILKIIFRILGKLISVKMILVMLGLIVVVGLMIVIALEIAILAALATLIIDNIVPLLGFMLFLIIFAVIIGILGWIAMFIIEYMIFAIAFFAALMVIIGLLLVTAIMLAVIAAITLDYNALVEVVTNIFAIIGMIIWQATLLFVKNIIFIELALSALLISVVIVLALLVVAGILWLLSKITLDRKVLDSQIDIIFDSINTIISKAAAFGWSLLLRLPLVILAIAGFVIMIIVVAMVIVLAAILWILSKIPLNEDVIMDKINTVFRICDHIINTIFNPEDKKGNKSNKTGFLGLLQTIFTAYKNIITMVFAVAYLALMVIAIAMILLLVGMLKLIEIIPFNIDRVLTNIDIIINTCQYIIDKIFTPKDDESNPSSRDGFTGFLKQIFAGTCDIIVTILTIAYLALMVIAIAMILLLVGMLKLIEVIPINRDKIMQKIDAVINTCQAIVTYLFGSDEEQITPSSQTGFASLIAKILRGLGDIVMAILGIAYLALMVIAIALILLLVGMLKLIEIISLNPDKILENVKLVINTCQTIIESIFYPTDDTTNNSSSRGIFMDLLNFIAPQLAKIVEAIFTIAYLALMVIAIALILLLVVMLKEIGETDPNIMSTAQEIAKLAVETSVKIIDMIFDQTDDKDSTGSSRGIIGDFINFIAPQVGKILDAIFAIAFLALAVIAIMIVKYLAQLLAEIGSINPNVFNNGVNIAKGAVTAACKIVNLVFAKDNSKEQEKKSWIGKVLEWVLPDKMKDIIDAILAVGKLAIMTMAIEAVGKLVQILNRIGSYKFNANAIYNAGLRVVNGANKLVNLIVGQSDVVKDDDIKKIHDYLTSIGSLALGIKLVCYRFQIAYDLTSKAIPWIDSCAEVIQHMNTAISGIEYDGVADKLDAIRSCLNKYTGVVNQIIYILGRLSITSSYNAPREMVDGLNDIIRDIDKVKVNEQHVRNIADLIEYVNTKISSITHVTAQDVKHSKELTDNYIKFLDKIDKSDFNKLNVTERMLAHWADLAHQVRGDFEGMANAINQHMVPMLETLNKTMEDVNDCQKKIMDELSIDNSGSSDGSNVTINEGDDKSTTSLNSTGGSSSNQESVGGDNVIINEGAQNEHISNKTEVTQTGNTSQGNRNLTQNATDKINAGGSTEILK